MRFLFFVCSFVFLNVFYNITLIMLYLLLRSGAPATKGRAATERFIISFLYDLSGRIKKYFQEIPCAARSNDLNAYGAKIFVFTQIQI